MATPIRRVITGHTAHGSSTVILDGPAFEGPLPHDRYVWTTDAFPAANVGATDAANAPYRLEPPANGSVFRIVELPPVSVMAELASEQKEAFFKELFAQMKASHCLVDTSRSPGMHKTNTIDYVVVLRGEITLLLDEGETTLKQGDVVVQRGTNHDWEVRGEESALIAVVMISAQPV